MHNFRDDLVTDMPMFRLYISDNTSELAKKETPSVRKNLIGTNGLSTVICGYKLLLSDSAIQSDPSGLCSASLASYNQRYNGSGIVGRLGLSVGCKMNKLRVINVSN